METMNNSSQAEEKKMLESSGKVEASQRQR